MANRSGISPGFSSGRAAAGAAGGIVGGLAFGLLMFAPAVVGFEKIGPRGVLPLVQAVLGTTSPFVIWAVHAALSILLGILFAMLVLPRGYGSAALWGVLYGAIVWLVSGQIVLRTLAGAPVLALDAIAWTSLAGHLLYGLLLGIVYVAFHHEEVREGMRAEDPRWRRWARRERDLESR